MVEVQRGNVCLDINEADIPKYMAKGFSVVDKDGNVIKRSIPTELTQLQKAYSEHIAMIEAKDTEIAKLKAEIQALKKSAGVKKTSAEDSSKTSEVAEDADDWGDWGEEPEEKTAKNKKSKK